TRPGRRGRAAAGAASRRRERFRSRTWFGLDVFGAASLEGSDGFRGGETLTGSLVIQTPRRIFSLGPDRLLSRATRSGEILSWLRVTRRPSPGRRRWPGESTRNNGRHVWS